MYNPLLKDDCLDDIADDEERWEEELSEVKAKAKADNVHLEVLEHR